MQNIYKNSSLATYPVNYNLLLPGSFLNKNLSVGEVGAQTQAYIDLCNALILVITTQQGYQTNLLYEQIQNQLYNSITQLNGFAENLLNAKYDYLIKYKVPYDMGLSEAIYLNKLPMSSYFVQIQLNYNLPDFNNIKQYTEITLTK